MTTTELLREPCYSCYKEQNRFHKELFRYETCGECFHVYTWLGLVLHDWFLRLRLNRNRPEWDFKVKRWPPPRPRLPRRIYVCPCCAHDL